MDCARATKYPLSSGMKPHLRKGECTYDIHTRRGGRSPKEADERNIISLFLHVTRVRGSKNPKNWQTSYVHAP